MKNSIIFIILTYIVAITFLILSTGIPGSDEVSTLTGPMQWPLALIIFMLVLNTIFLINTIRSKDGKKEVATNNKIEKIPDSLDGVLSDEQKKLTEDNAETNEVVKEGWKSYRHYILIGLMILYVILLSFSNFLIATIIFFPLCSFIMGERNKITITVSSIVATFLVYGLFEHLLNVPLP